MQPLCKNVTCGLHNFANMSGDPLPGRGLCGDCASKELHLVIAARDEARANARILAHAYEHDSRPPPKVVAQAKAYPVAAGDCDCE